MHVLRDRYELNEVIGAGGAAKVYRAEDAALDRTVAVKLLDDDVARSADPTNRERFLQEAELASQVRHPNLVTVFDAGEDDGVLYMVMEYVDGATLAERISTDAPMPVDQAVAITLQILDGLAALHNIGTIHRDVKPSNILIGQDGRVRLADFGIAKRLDQVDAAVTAVGTLVGTPHYLTPEQATGRPQSPATDIYQVGLVLHEMLTGRRAGGADPARAALVNAADPRELRPEVPAFVAEVVVRATQREPGRRYASATEMCEALTAAAQPPKPAVGRVGVARTMTMPLDVATVRLSATSSGSAPETRVLEPRTDAPPVGTIRSRPAGRFPLLVSAIVAFVTLLGIGAALVFGDGGANPRFGVDDTSVVPSTPPAPNAPVTAAPTTVPFTEPPPAPQPAQGKQKANGQKPGKGSGRDKKDHSSGP